MIKPSVFLLTAGLILTGIAGSAQEHRVKYSNGTDIIIGAPKSNYSFNNKTEYKYQRGNTTNYKPTYSGSGSPVEGKLSPGDSAVRYMSCNYSSLIAKHDYLDKLKLALNDSSSIKGYTSVPGASPSVHYYKYIDSNHDGLYAVKIKDYWGYVDVDANWKYYCVCDSALGFHDGFSFAEKGGKWGVIGRKYPGMSWEAFTIVIPMLYDDFRPFHRDMVAMKRDGKWGYFNDKGELVIPIIYDEVGKFSQGVVNVKKDGAAFYINTSGKEVFANHFDDANSYADNVAEVKLNGKWGMIDMQGALVMPYSYNDDVSCRVAYNKKTK